MDDSYCLECAAPTLNPEDLLCWECEFERDDERRKRSRELNLDPSPRSPGGTRD